MDLIKGNWYKIIAVILSFYALNDLSFGYYQILRWFIFLSSAYILYLNYSGKKEKFPWVFLIIGILFNPLAPIYLEKNTWHIINIIVGIVYIISLPLMDLNKYLNKKHVAYFAAIVISIILVIISFSFLWGRVNLGINKEYLLKQSIEKYSNLLEVGLAEQAYHEFLTPEAKSRVAYRYEDLPYTPEELKAEEVRIANCPKNSGRLSEYLCSLSALKHQQRQIEIPSIDTFTKYAVTRKNDWKDIEIDKIVYPTRNRAEVLLKFKDKTRHTNDSLETWYFQNGKWLRDF